MILARFRRGLILGCALRLGVVLASWQNSALAGVSEQGYAKNVPPLTSDARASGAIVAAENDGDHNGDDKKHRKGKNASRDRDSDNRRGDGSGDNGHRHGENNGNWNDHGNWKKYGKKSDHDAMVTTITGRVKTTATGRSTAKKRDTTATETGARMATNIGAETTKTTVTAGAVTTTIGTRNGIGVPMCEIGITSLIMASSSAASFSGRF
jgi:hypothetical protein